MAAAPPLPLPDQVLPVRGEEVTWPWLVLFITVLLLTSLVRLRLLSVPLERDEGGYATIAQLWREGTSPWDPGAPQIYGVPGIYACYRLILEGFGATTEGIHLGLLCAHLLAALLVTAIGKKLYGIRGGLAVGAAYAMLCLSRTVWGFTANTEPFVLLPVLASLWLLLGNRERADLRTIFTAGLLLGVAITVKHTGAVFLAFTAAYLAISGWRRGESVLSRLAALFLGALIPPLFALAAFYRAGTLGSFWFWFFVDPSHTLGNQTLAHGLTAFSITLRRVAETFPVFLLLAVLGWFRAGKRTGPAFGAAPSVSPGLFTRMFFIFSFLALCPGLYFWPHYFLLWTPAVALLAAAGLETVHEFLPARRAGRVTLALMALAAAVWPLREYGYLFQWSPRQVSRYSYGPGLFPFPEAVGIGEYIRAHSDPDDTVAVIGSEPEIYFYSGRRPAAGPLYIEHLGDETPAAEVLKQDFMSRITAARPRFLVFEPGYLEGRAQDVLDWFRAYHRRYYRRVGVVDIQSPEKTVYVWGAAAVRYVPSSPYWLSVDERIRP